MVLHVLDPSVNVLIGELWTVRMAVPVVEFSIEGYKINCIQMKLPNFENWSNGMVSKSDKI